MAELKTKPHKGSVTEFLKSVSNEIRRKDAQTVLKLMKQITGERPKMWGPTMVGFGSYHYKYASGREGDWFVTGFSPRSQALTLYIMAGFTRYDSLMKKLGKYKTGRSCLYIKNLEDIDTKVLKQLVELSVKHVAKHQGC